MNKELSIAYDTLALQCYFRGEYRHAYTYGKMALQENPQDGRLRENMKWYKNHYTEKPSYNCAWVTLLSDNSFINGVIVLHRSLIETETKYPLYVAVTDDVSEENLMLLEQLHIPTLHFDILIPPNMNKEDAPDIITTLDEYGWHKALCKLNMFGLTQFDKIVFIDADIIVKNNMDELFSKPHLTACEDYGSFSTNTDETYSLNSGLVVIEPDEQTAINIIQFLEQFDSQGKLIHDQWIIQEYYKGWKEAIGLHLSPYYAIWTTRFDENRVEYYYHRHKIKSIHMIDVKPWRKEKKYFMDWMDIYPIYAKLCLDYIDILNFTIKDLESQGITSSNLKIIY